MQLILNEILLKLNQNKIVKNANKQKERNVKKENDIGELIRIEFKMKTQKKKETKNNVKKAWKKSRDANVSKVDGRLIF